MGVPPPPQKVCKVFEGETLGLDFGVEKVFVGVRVDVVGGSGLSSRRIVFTGEIASEP